MSRLTKWVESLERNVKIHKAANTKSLYYTVQNTVIRISDHFSISKGWDIQIIIPLNNTKTYLLGISEGSDVLTFTFSELKTFIQNYLYINRIKSSKENIDKSKDTISFDLNNPKERIANWCQVVPIFRKYGINKFTDLSKSKKKFIQDNLFAKPIPFDDCIRILSDFFTKNVHLCEKNTIITWLDLQI